MDVEELAEGDRILIDVNTVMEFGEVDPPWTEIDNVISDIEKIRKSTIEISTKINDNEFPEDVEMRDEWIGARAEGRIKEEAIISKLCKKCDSQLVYHDTREEWICLSCEEIE